MKQLIVDQYSAPANFMNSFNKISIVISLLGITIFYASTSQQPYEDSLLNNDQIKVLNLYAEEYLLEENQHLYYQSIDEKSLLKSLAPPLTSEDFTMPEIATLPGKEIQKADTLFSKEELNAWSKQISGYNQVTWTQSNFPDSVDFIRAEEIPDYLNRSDIPPPGQDPVFIHYISIPFIFDGESALMYAKKWSSGANVETLYLYFVKVDGKWRLKTKGHNSVGY